MTLTERRLLAAIAHALLFLIQRTVGGDNTLMQQEKDMERRLLQRAVDEFMK